MATSDNLPEDISSSQAGDGMADIPQSESDFYDKYSYEVRNYEREFKRWQDRCKKIVRRYKDERNAYEDQLSRFNILWSNLETLAPLIYARTPKPAVTRRHKDPDKLGRVSARVLERVLDFMVNRTTFDEAARCAVKDLLLPGRGVAWVRYVPHFRDAYVKGNEEVQGEGVQTANSDEEPEREDDEPVRICYYEEAIPDYVNWLDFGHNVARTWDEVRLVWRKTYLTRDELIERFGEKGKEIPLDYSPEKTDTEDTPTQVRKASVIELWDKLAKQTAWFSIHKKLMLDLRDDPLKLDDFFPCPMPIYATLGNDSLIPVPDYFQYQDQAQELDELTGRIGAIQKAIKAVGVYDASAQAVQRILAEGVENQLLPVDQWAMFAEKGGLKGVMEFVPMKEIMETLLGLHEARDSVKQIIYEVTGMSDIIRGANDPSETATSTQKKSHFAMIRLVHKQRNVQRFLRDIMRIMGQIAVEHFEDDTLKKYSGMKLLTRDEKTNLQKMLAQQEQMQQLQQQQAQLAQAHGQQPPPMQPMQPPPQDMLDLLDEPAWEDVFDLLRDDSTRNFHIDIETDSTVYEDEQEEKQTRLEFLNAASQYIGQVGTMMQLAPQSTPLLMDLLMFGVRSFRVSSELETRFEQTVKVFEKIAAQAPPPGQNNQEAQKAQAQMQIEQQKMQNQLQIEQQKMQLEDQSRQKELQQKGQLAQLEQQAETQNDAARNQMESQRETVKMQQDLQIRQLEMQQEKELETMKLQNQMAIEQMKLRHDASMKTQDMQHQGNIKQMELQHQGAMEQLRREHEAKNPPKQEGESKSRELTIRHIHDADDSGQTKQ